MQVVLKIVDILKSFFELIAELLSLLGKVLKAIYNFIKN